MFEKRLSPEKEKKIAEIKEEWKREIDKIPEKKYPPRVFVLDGGNSGRYTELAKKYHGKIMEIVNSSD